MSEVTVWMRKQADNKNLVPPFGYWLGNASFHHAKKGDAKLLPPEHADALFTAADALVLTMRMP